MNAIRLQRFKGFLDSGWIELKPITLLFGYNSSGKSSILNALLMLKQSLENPSLEVPFVFTMQKGIDLGSFVDAVYNHEVNHNNPMIISLRVNIDKYLNQRGIKENVLDNFEIDLNIDISYNQKRRFNTIIGFSICDNKGKVLLKMNKISPAQNAKEIFSSEYFLELNNRDIKLEWYNFLPIIKDPVLKNHYITYITEAIRENIILSFKNLSNIGPVRAIPERSQTFSGESPLNVGVSGDDAFKLLYLDKFSANSKGLEDKVNNWLNKYDYKFEWKIFNNNLGQFILIDRRTNLRVSIKDVGFGLSQILPIVIQVYNVTENGMVLIEQPEIHLHARAQADLGDLFINAVEETLIKSIGKRYSEPQKLIVETHSEHLLLRIRRRFAETYLKFMEENNLFYPQDYSSYNCLSGRLNSDEVAIYYIENPQGYSSAYKITIDDKGELLNIPDGFKKFFTDDFEEIMKINKTLAQIKST